MTSTDAPSSDGRQANPRITTTGRCSTLPPARSAADASSSATAIRVACISRPDASGVPRRSRSASIPAEPTATLTMPLRHGRPNESLMMIAGEAPVRVRNPSRMPRAEASGSSGSSDATSPPPTLLTSTPALAQTNPCRVRLMIRPPGPMRTMDADSRRTSSTWRGSLPHCEAHARAKSDGSTDASSTSLPSALETTFWVTTSTSASARRTSEASAASAMSAARSSPGATSGMPSRPMSSRRDVTPRRRA